MRKVYEVELEGFGGGAYAATDRKIIWVAAADMPGVWGAYPAAKKIQELAGIPADDDHVDVFLGDDISVAVTLGRGQSLGLTDNDHLVVASGHKVLADLGPFTKKRAAALCEYIQRLAIHVP